MGSPMTIFAIRLLAVAALAVTLFGAQRSLAGGPAPGCCVCVCPGLADQCRAASSPAECAAVCPIGIDCAYLFNNNTCAADPACASAPAPAPSLDTTGLAAAVVLLSGLAALRLRRVARQRQR